MTVPIRALAGVLMLALVACGDDPGALPVRATRSFSLPTDGPRLPSPRSLTRGPSGELVALDTAGRVVVMDESGAVLRSWSMPDNANGNPEGVLVTREGHVVVCDTHYHRVIVYDGTGAVLRMFGSEGKGPGQFVYPVAVAEDADGRLYVGEYGGNDRIQRFAPDGTYQATIGGFGTGAEHLQRPSGIVWHEGTLYVADAVNHRIQAYRDDGTYVGEVGDSAALGWHFPYDLTLGPEGDLWVVEYGAGRVTRLGRDGALRGRHGTTGTGRDQLRTPWGLAVGPTQVTVADTGNRRLVAFLR